jgi:phage tail sheath gpL-like
LDVLYKLEELEIVEEVDANKDGVIVEKDLQDNNRLDAKIPTDVVNGLHVFAARIDLLL